MIRLANLEDVTAIMSFIHEEWKANHILSQNKEFFLYEHQNGQAINFVLSINEEQQINGVLGFIPASFGTKVDICTVIWKVSKHAGNPMLGVQLLEFLRNLGQFRTVMSVGINAKTIGIYQFLGMYTNQLKQYVLFNTTLNTYTVAKVTLRPNKVEFVDSNGFELKLLDRDFSFDFEQFDEHIQFKDEHYFKKRYFDHPIYTYQSYGIINNGVISSILVSRIQETAQGNVLRIVDFIGDETTIKYIAKFILEILVRNNLEYADFFCYGLAENELAAAGFIEVDPAQENLIVPNYFNPFVQQNIKINFFSDTQYPQNLKLFKADGDQDRPN